MALSVLVASPDKDWCDEVHLFLEKHNYDCESVNNGKDCQLKVYKKKYICVVLDLRTQSNSAFEVLKYLRLNAPSVNVLLVVESKERLNELELKKDDLRKLGASDILVQPFSVESLLKSIEGANQFESWKDIKNSGSQKEEQEIKAKDSEFTKVKIQDFLSGNTNIFDFFIRLGPNKYIKLLHRGDFFEKERIKKYVNDQSISHLYFKTKERGVYINFINNTLEKMIKSTKVSPLKKIETAKNLTEKYIEEIYVSGLKPQLIEEGKKICENMAALIKKDPDLDNLMTSYEKYDPTAFGHLFLVSFFSSIICQNLDWSSDRTVQIIAFGSLLHDIGKMKLPLEFKNLQRNQMTTLQRDLYETHPKLGAEMLQQYTLITEPIRQIVYQHHEYNNGEGFPNGLTGIRIYPLAKVVSFADEYTNVLIEKKLSPIDGLKFLLADRSKMMKFDPEVVKALVKAFSRKKNG